MKKIWILCLCCFVSPALILECANAPIKLEGLEHDPDLVGYITEVALSPYTAKSENPARLAKVRADIIKALEAMGYYDSKVTMETVEENTEIVFHIKSGSQYTIDHIEIIGFDGPYVLPLTKYDSLLAQSVLDAQQQILNEIAQKKCIYKLSVRHEISLNHDEHTADVRFIVEGEKDAKFGVTEFKGNETIKDKYLFQFLTYREGDCWTARKVERTRSALMGTGLLSRVNVDVPGALPESGYVPITLILQESNPRKIRLGGQYSTWEGFGVNLEWRHRNYFGSGEEVSATANASKFLQSLALDFEKPFFLSKRQDLNISVTAKRQDTDAFEEINFDVQNSIDRKLSGHWSVNVGIGFEATNIDEKAGDQNTFGLVSFPAQLDFDNRDDPLDPHKGYNFSYGVRPFFDMLGVSDPFFKHRVTCATYFKLSDSSFDPVLALRSSVGSILGSRTADIPASKRFYAGGGGSIRGFGFQEVGPVSEDGDPVGGRSILETTAELRLKFTDTIGAVAFVDAGNVNNETVLDLEEGLYVGAGMGLRYYTSFGPIRFDVATPVNNKERANQEFQVYISIGQAF